MKEMVSFHDDAEKRLGIFFGLGAFLLSSVFALFQGLPPEALLLRGVVVLILCSLMGWVYGVWLKNTLIATKPQEEMPANMERRSRNAENLDEGTVIMPGLSETVVGDDPDNFPATGQVVNFTLPEFDPLDAPLQGVTPAPRKATAPAGPMIPTASVAAANATAAAASVATLADEGDLPPPPVPSWLK